jgi:predicted glycogen debranching enzyme
MLQFKDAQFEDIKRSEWLITNGLGSYASSSVAGANTRRYHGLLVAAFNPPTDRRVLVSKVEETVLVGDKQIELSVNQYGDYIHPQGCAYLTTFERLPIPRWTYQMEGYRLEKTVFMVQGVNTTVVGYKNASPTALTLRLNPLFVHRDYHSMFHQNDQSNFYTEQSDKHFKIYAHYGAEPLFFQFSKGVFKSERNWYKNFTYFHEQERGLDAQEDAYSLGYLKIELEAGEECFLTFSTVENDACDWASASREQEISRVKMLQSTQNDAFLKDLVVSADQFVVQRQSTESATVIAGYHWFTDWGRDTMIALRGLCIALGHQQKAQDILTTFFKYVNKGLLPNRFPDNPNDPVEYNTIDATLWLFIALYEYHQKFNDTAFVAQHFDQLLAILDAHVKGTHYNIHVTKDGLLYGGEGIAQLTWMDARVGDYVVTPRHGCPVEVNALWYNALHITLYFGKLLKKGAPQYKTLLKQFEANFKAKFWNEAGYLNDVVNADQTVDTQIRPNQIYALSLPFPLLNAKEQAQVLATVQKHLYTPLGLRTLSPDDAAFTPTYGGDQWHRDTAYHQGTVWTFLLSEYWQAYLKVAGFSEAAKAEMRDSLADIKTHFYEKDCVMGISEIFDGLTPNEGRGTANQAWSVAAIVKLLVENPPITHPKKQQ